jgi:hypothetical protein
MITSIEETLLLEIISQKHYQKYHPKVLSLLSELEGYKEVDVFHANTFDEERAKFIFNNLNFEGLKVLDIGANIGYFTFCSVFAGASTVTSIESDEIDSKLIHLETKLLGVLDTVNVIQDSFNFSIKQKSKHDVVLCLNVLHHLGRYFDNTDLSLKDSKNKMVEYLNLLSYSTKYCWFQMGFNWKGDENSPLFDNGLKSEVIDFIHTNCSDYWEVQKIAILDDETMQYSSINPKIQRIDKLGEFGNRPLFLLKSKMI